MSQPRTFTPRVGDNFVLVTPGGNSFPARLVATDIKGDFPILAVVANKRGAEVVRSANAEGEIFSIGHLYDAPVVEERWVNLGGDFGGRIVFGDVVETREQAAAIYPSPLCRLRFELIDGEPANPEFVK